MNKRWFMGIIALVLFFCFAQAGWALQPFQITSYVTDQAGMLSAEQQSTLATELDRYAQQTGNQILVVTIPTLEDQELVDYTEQLFKLNKPGQKGKDNGIILLIAKEERKIRIEVGYGLEEAVPDGKAGSIIRDQIAPFFKQGNYPNGILTGTVALIHAITPDYTMTIPVVPAARQSSPGIKTEFPVDLFSVGVVAFLVLIPLFSALGNQGRYRRGYSETWYWGGGSDSGGFGGGSSGGDFSGGGGDFGGGGASGDW